MVSHLVIPTANSPARLSRPTLNLPVSVSLLSHLRPVPAPAPVPPPSHPGPAHRCLGSLRCQVFGGAIHPELPCEYRPRRSPWGLELERQRLVPWQYGDGESQSTFGRTHVPQRTTRTNCLPPARQPSTHQPANRQAHPPHRSHHPSGTAPTGGRGWGVPRHCTASPQRSLGRVGRVWTRTTTISSGRSSYNST